MRRKSVQVLVAVSVLAFMVVSAVPSFAAASSHRIKEIQTALNHHGIKVAVDGRMGKETHDALARYQKANGLAVTGRADAPTLTKLGVK
jgi:peptidoglycan hydrolase-like protein with peptidoglycan-binding domain